MSGTGAIFEAKQDGKCGCLSRGAMARASRLDLVTVGILCCAIVLSVTYAVSAQLPDVLGRPPLIRQVQKAVSLYRLDSPVQLEEHVVKVELRSADKVGWQVKLPPEVLASPAQRPAAESSGTAKPEGFAAILQCLKFFGESTVMHNGAWIITGAAPTNVYSGKTIPVEQTAGVGDGKTTASRVERREVGRKLTVNLEGIDAEQRICFSYSIELNYVEGKLGEGNLTFSNFNAEGRIRAKDGETVVVQNIEGSTALLIFFTPHVMK